MLPYTTEEIQARVEPIAKKYELAAVYLFGSYARGDATASSDVDLLVDLSGSPVRGLMFARLYNELEEALGVRIDLVTLDSLEQPSDFRSDKYFRDNVHRERKMIYAVA
ncbi:MAG: nucleotidyltransferase domain-containing protein [Oscillospiraceae bacterium]|nr:nucleotidyltransferase domain-containing protein [Oscillospiraceae bacterium]